MKQNILNLCVFAVLGLVLVSSFALPLMVAGAEVANTKTYTNESDYKFSEIDVSSGTVELTPTAAGFAINGVTYTNTGSHKYIFSDEFKMTTTSTNTFMNCLLYTNGVTGSYITKITIADGTATFTYTSASNLTGDVTCNCTWLAVSDDAGDWQYCESGAYINDTDTYYLTYPLANIDSDHLGFTATVSNGAIASVNGASISGTTITDISENVTSNLSVNDHYATATVTYNDTDYTLGWLVPETISITDDTPIGSLIELIPLLLVVALVLGVVAYAVRARLS